MMIFVVCLVGFLFGISLLVSIKVMMAVVVCLVLMVLFQCKLKWLFYAYLFSVFFFPPTIGVDTPFILLNVDRIVLALLLGSWVLAIASGKRPIVSSPLDKSIFFYIFAASVSILVNIRYILGHDLIVSSMFQVFSLFMERVLIIYVLLSTINSKSEIKSILVFSIVCLSIVAAYGIYESRTHFNIFTKFTMIKREQVNLTVLSENLRVGMYRAKSTQMLPHVFGTGLCMMFPLALYAGFYMRGLLRFGAGIAAILFLGGIAVTFTRGVYLSLILAVIISFFYLRSSVKRVILIVLVAVAIGVSMTIPSAQLFYSQYLSRLVDPKLMTYDREHSIQSRLRDYAYTLTQLKETPLLGKGPGTHIAGQFGTPYLDNVYLYVLIEGGLVGFTAFILLLYGIVFRIGRMIRSRLETDPDALLMRFVHIAVVIFYFQCLTYDAFGLGGASKLFWVILGLILTYLRVTEKAAASANA